MERASVPVAPSSTGLSSPSGFFSTFVLGRKSWDLCCGRWCQGNSCYLQFLFSPLQTHQLLFNQRKQWNLDNKSMKTKVKATLSTVVYHLSLAPCTRTQNFKRKHDAVPHLFPQFTFHQLLLDVRFEPSGHDGRIHWPAASWFWLMTLFCK